MFEGIRAFGKSSHSRAVQTELGHPWAQRCLGRCWECCLHSHHAPALPVPRACGTAGFAEPRPGACVRSHGHTAAGGGFPVPTPEPGCLRDRRFWGQRSWWETGRDTV